MRFGGQKYRTDSLFHKLCVTNDSILNWNSKFFKTRKHVRAIADFNRGVQSAHAGRVAVCARLQHYRYTA